MSKKTTLESAYFHVSNSGFSYRIVEKVDKRENCTVFPPDWFEGLRTGKYKAGGFYADGTPLPEETHYNRSWFMEVNLNTFGSGISFRFPLVPVKVRWMVEALQRVLARMEAPQDAPTDGIEFAFRDTKANVRHRDGEPCDS